MQNHYNYIVSGTMINEMIDQLAVKLPKII